MLVRHGETDWSRTGRHTGRTDVGLTERGQQQAQAVGAALRARRFVVVLTSPLERAGYGDVAARRDELMEWDYGAYEGRKTLDIRKGRPEWTLWRDGVPDGETAAEVGARVDRLIDELRSADGDAAVFSHGHLLRVLAARWIGLEPWA